MTSINARSEEHIYYPLAFLVVSCYAIEVIELVQCLATGRLQSGDRPIKRFHQIESSTGKIEHHSSSVQRGVHESEREVLIKNDNK